MEVNNWLRGSLFILADSILAYNQKLSENEL